MYISSWRLVRRNIISTVLIILISMLVLGCTGDASQVKFESALFTIQSTTSSYAIESPNTGITISVNRSGVYSVLTRNPTWTFSGTVGHQLSHIFTSSGSDKLGKYQEILFNYQGNVGRLDSIRTYAARSVVLFSTTYLQASSNTDAFPTFTTYPDKLYHLSYRGSFGVYQFNLSSPSGPWLFFDRQAHSFLLSPAANFPVATMAVNDNGSISSGINPAISSLPQNFSQQTMLAVGNGINSVYNSWGQAMTDLQGKVRPANDANVTLNTLGYWTDRGATYYYRYNPQKGYAGTLLAIKKDFAEKGIPLGYMQLDSWWYPKGGATSSWSHASGGINTFIADPTLFPEGLGAFHQQLGLPLVVHARWIDSHSPYRAEYAMSGNVPIDPTYWKMVMDYIASDGVVTYEQDWLSAQAHTALNLNDPGMFLNEMANSASADGLTLQYCMAMPYDYLQSTLYNNAVTIRVSNDHFVRARWDQFLYDSRFASALGLWPWSDVFMSDQTGNLLLSTLSAGMVGVGDPLGAESKTNLMQTVRADGVIVKPDTSIVPVDETYIAQAQNPKAPMVAAAYTYHGSLSAAYVFAYSRNGASGRQIATFTPASLGISGNAYIYNYFTGRGTLVKAGQSFSEQVNSAGSYDIVVPVGQSGIAFLGDAGKFVSLGKKRISGLSDNGVLHATVTFAANEKSVILRGYAPSLPRVSATNGHAGPVSYNSQTHLFSFPVLVGAAHTAVINVSL